MHHEFDGDIIPQSEIDFLLGRGHIDDELPYNFCPDCRLPMCLDLAEYQCKECGLTMKSESGEIGNKIFEDIGNACIRITTGTNRGRFYNTPGDYSKTQRKVIAEQLARKAKEYIGPAFSQDVLAAATTQYNYIQRFITEEDYDANGAAIAKKFVHRSNYKDEVLAGLIYFEGIRVGIFRKKKDISTFMKLTTNGFARGEDVLRNLHAEGKIDLPVDREDTVEGFLDRYLEALNIESTRHSGFVIDIITEAERRKLGVGSQLSSKIVGALWILITKLKLNITAKALEDATDNTRKNTFMKFHKIICDNYPTFHAIFVKHGVPKP